MMVGTRLAFSVTKVTTTVATHSPRPPRNMPSQGRLLHHLPALVWVPGVVVVGVAAISVMARSSVVGGLTCLRDGAPHRHGVGDDRVDPAEVVGGQVAVGGGGGAVQLGGSAGGGERGPPPPGCPRPGGRPPRQGGAPP